MKSKKVVEPKPLTEREQLLARLKELDIRECTAREERLKEAEASFNALPWVWTVKPGEYHDWKDGKVQGAHINRQKDHGRYAAHAARYGEHIDQNRLQGMFYYRTLEGILTQTGGGYHLLKVPRLCSDDEWAEILSGRIPEKFLR